MIEQGVNGISRGCLSEGVMRGEITKSFHAFASNRL
jgi:hypothetical protein